MAIYVEILSAALAADGGDHDVPVLIDRVRETRTKMLEAHHAFRSVYDAVAAEVAYDRELVQLCAALGIETGPARFGSPTTERKRLEWELALIGIDLVAQPDSQSQRPSRQAPDGSHMVDRLGARESSEWSI